MTPQDPLANLHPLRQPELIGWWPPAPGWWLLLCLVILVVTLVVYFGHRHYKKNMYRRRALRQLQALHEQHETGSNNTHEHLSRINVLLKSVALLAYPPATVAAQHGEAWRGFLNLSLPPAAQLQSDFDQALYQKHCPDIDMAHVHRAAQLWIKKHRATR